MASNYWAKLWIEMLDDPKVARLPDSSWRRFSECILLAKELDEGGYLPTVADMAWRLRKDETTIADDMTRLALAGLAELRETADGERWFLPGFENRQSQMSDAERQRRYRERNAVVRLSSQPGNARITNRNDNRYAKVTEPVTKRNTETEIEKETETEGEQREGATPTPQSRAPQPVPTLTAQAHPAVKAIHQVTTYWPGENVTDELVAALGETPDIETLRRANQLWLFNGYKPTNFAGICQWYQELLRDPAWTPQARFKSGNGNGHKPAVTKSVSTPTPGSQPVRW